MLPAQPVNGRVGDHNFHNWYVYSGDHPVKGKFGIHFDGQVRRAKGSRTWQQLLLRPGVNYQLTKNVSVGGGYGYIRSYPYGDFPAPAASPEHRLYQQLILSQTLGRVSLSHRYRNEQRFIGVLAPVNGAFERVDWRFQQRVRYQFRAEIPIKAPVPDKVTPYVALWDEVKINYGANFGASIFDQNRIFGGVGWRLNRYDKFEAGYMNQTLAQRNGRVIEYNHTLVFTFSSTRPFGRAAAP